MGGGFSSVLRVDSYVSRRFPTFHLKNRRTFALFTSSDREKSLLTEQVSRKDKAKAEGDPNKQRLSIIFSGFLPHFPGRNAHFPSSA
jgi:hypothetical protein